MEEKEPSSVCAAVLAYNEDEIWRIARYSAMQAMPLLLARGEDTSLSKETVLLKDTISEMIRGMVDEKEEYPIEQPSLYKIEIHLAKQFGEGISDRAKNEFVLDIDVTIPLEFESILFPPEHYKIIKKMAKPTFKSDE
jgi:hypothetical protein